VLNIPCVQHCVMILCAKHFKSILFAKQSLSILIALHYLLNHIKNTIKLSVWMKCLYQYPVTDKWIKLKLQIQHISRWKEKELHRILLIISTAIHGSIIQWGQTGCKFSVFLSFTCRRNKKRDIDWLIIWKIQYKLQDIRRKILYFCARKFFKISNVVLRAKYCNLIQ
jgi:hypothetical protein